LEKRVGAAWTESVTCKTSVKKEAARASTYLVTRGGGNNSATTTPITNIQIKLLLSSNLSTARLFSGENKSVAKINVLHTVLSRPTKVPNLIVTATITTKNKNGSKDFSELCLKEKVRRKLPARCQERCIWRRHNRIAVPVDARRISLMPNAW